MEYSRNEVESMLISLFPDVQKKGVRLEMYYENDLVGKVMGIRCRPFGVSLRYAHHENNVAINIVNNVNFYTLLWYVCNPVFIDKQKRYRKGS